MKKTAAARRHPRLTVRGWLTVTDLIAAACAVWIGIGTWKSTGSVGDTAVQAVLLYGAVHVFAPLAKGGVK